jgi:hypothetical protein
MDTYVCEKFKFTYLLVYPRIIPSLLTLVTLRDKVRKILFSLSCFNVSVFSGDSGFSQTILW